MPDPADDVVRRRMQQQGRRDTEPELLLRRELHRRGLRFRVDRSPVRGMRSRADIVFGPAKVAVFVDGCYWHGCPTHGSLPKHNSDWWAAKLAGNQARDRRVDAELDESGWLSLRFWEHEDVPVCADVVEREVRQRARGNRR